MLKTKEIKKEQQDKFSKETLFLLKDKYRGAMLGLAIGDALGMPTEFLSPHEIKEIYGKITKFEKAPQGLPCHKLKSGQYTDDTQMAIRLAMAIQGNKFKFNITKIEKQFIKWYYEDDPRSPGGACTMACRSLIEKYKKHDYWPPSETSAGNGSMMRVTPIALLTRNYEELKEYAISQSEITHGDPRAHEASFTTAYIIKELIWDGNIYEQDILECIQDEEFKDRLRKTFLFAQKGKQRNIENNDEIYTKYLGTSGFVIDTLCSALYTFLRYDDPKEGLCKVASMGGDADTITAIAGTFYGAKLGYSNLPNFGKLENTELLLKISDWFYYNTIKNM